MRERGTVEVKIVTRARERKREEERGNI